MLRNRENSDVFHTLDEIYLVFTSKKVNILYLHVHGVKCNVNSLTPKLSTIFLADANTCNLNDPHTCLLHQIKYFISIKS